jgi:hypothetical protein
VATAQPKVSATARVAVDVPAPSSPPVISLGGVKALAPSASAAASNAPPLAIRRVAGCEVVVESLVDANVFRGSPRSQMTADMYARDPDFERFSEGADHGAQYLSCTWVLRIDGARFRYKRASHTGPAIHRIEPSLCSERAEADATAEDVQRFTQACTNLRGGEYYGDILEPITP